MNEPLPFDRVRSEQPLSDDDFAAIRRGVLQQVAVKELRRWMPLMRAAFVVVAAVAIALTLFTANRDNRSRPAPAAKQQPSPSVAPTAPHEAATAVQPTPIAQPIAPPGMDQHESAAASQASQARIEQVTEVPPPHVRNRLHRSLQHVASPRTAPRHRHERDDRDGSPLLASAAPVRVELHTQNPDIRIIWMTSQQ